MKHTLLLLLFLVTGALKAQSLSSDDLYVLCSEKMTSWDSILIKKGFKEKYSRPKKEGGYIALYQNKTKNEYIFVYANNDEKTTNANYYLPTKKAYLALCTDKKNLPPGFDYNRLGKVEYEGKIYYHLGFSIKEVTTSP